MRRKATAHWQGDLKTGTGHLTTQSTTLNQTQYSFKTRFEEGVGTNPEELLAAAHAGCFTMSVAAQLTNAGYSAESLDTEAILTLEGLDITAINLSISASVPKISAEHFAEIAESAKTGCIISKALNASVVLTLEANLTN